MLRLSCLLSSLLKTGFLIIHSPGVAQWHNTDKVCMKQNLFVQHCITGKCFPLYVAKTNKRICKYVFFVLPTSALSRTYLLPPKRWEKLHSPFGLRLSTHAQSFFHFSLTPSGAYFFLRTHAIRVRAHIQKKCSLCLQKGQISFLWRDALCKAEEEEELPPKTSTQEEEEEGILEYCVHTHITGLGLPL